MDLPAPVGNSTTASPPSTMWPTTSSCCPRKAECPNTWCSTSRGFLTRGSSKAGPGIGSSPFHHARPSEATDPALREVAARVLPAPPGSLHPQEPAGLAGPEEGIDAVALQQLGVGALFGDAALVQHDNAVEPGDGRQPVRDGDHRLARHQPVERRLDRRLDLA